MSVPPLILASTSSTRRGLLAALGLPFECVRPAVDETPLPGEEPEALARRLGLAKAREVAQRFPEAVVIGADQVCDLDGRALGKPADAAAALGQLTALAGRSHRLVTGLAVVGPGGAESLVVDVVTLTLFPLTPAELDAYVASGEWEGCCGSYRVEGRGGWLFQHIAGDLTSVQGLPLRPLVAELRARGLSPLRR